MAGVPLAHAALLGAVTTLAYARSFDGGWISDDWQAIVHNPLLRSLGPSNLGAIFTSFDDSNYIPLKVLSLAVDYRLWGLRPAGFHLTNLVLHTASALAIYTLLRRFGETAGLALAVSLLWSVHPVQVESVAWVSERKNVLSTLFFLLALHAWVSFSDRPRAVSYLALLALFTGALLSKINTIVLPAIVLAYELVFHRRLRARDLAGVAPLLVIGAGLAWWHLAGNPVHGRGYHGGSLAATLRTSATVVPAYLVLVAAPFRLSTVHSVPLRAAWLDPAVVASAGMIVALATATVVLLARRAPAGFWLAWFGITLSPMLNLIPFPALMAERYLYVPILGLLVVLARGAPAVLPSRALPILTAVLALGCAARTHARVPAYHDDVAMFADWAVVRSYQAADRPYRRTPDGERLGVLRAALATNPSSAALHNNLGATAFEGNAIDDARAALERARGLDASDPTIALNLGQLYLYLGRAADAVPLFSDAVRGAPLLYHAHLGLARAHLALGDAARARPALAEARRVRPDMTTWRTERQRLERLEGKGSAR